MRTYFAARLVTLLARLVTSATEFAYSVFLPRKTLACKISASQAQENSVTSTASTVACHRHALLTRVQASMTFQNRVAWGGDGNGTLGT